MRLDIKEIQAALDRAAYKAVHGTREERSGRFFRTETKMAMEQYRKVLPFREVPSDDLIKVIRALFDHLDVEIVQEETPDYTSYEVRAKKRP